MLKHWRIWEKRSSENSLNRQPKREKKIWHKAERELGKRFGKPLERETAEKAAEKAAQFPQDVTEAKGLCEANDIIGTSIPILLGQLMALKKQYRWIEYFRVEPKSKPNHFKIVMVASETDIDEDYTPDNENGVPKPKGSLKRVDEKWLKRHGVDPHEVKKGLPGSISEFDIYKDNSDNLFALRKGAPESTAEWLGHLDSFKS